MNRLARRFLQRPAIGLWLSFLLAPAPLLAQGSGNPLDFTGKPPAETPSARDIPEAVLRAAVEAFNQANNRVVGEAPALGNISGTLGIYRGAANLTGLVTGDIVVLNSDLRISSTARIEGRITVLGGRLVVEPGAVIRDTTVYPEYAPVERQGDGTLRITSNRRSLSTYTSASFAYGAFEGKARLSFGSYNRVEGLSLRALPTLVWHLDSTQWLRLDLGGTARTATASGEARPVFGGDARLTAHIDAPLPFTVGVHVGNVISPMADRPLPPLESSLSALLLRRDQRDWYRNRYWGLFGEVSLRPALTLTGGLDFSREEGIRAADVFSVINSSKPWRANPLIDDGRFVTASVGLRWDTRDNPDRAANGVLAEVQLTRVMSHALTPVSLPTTIRTELANDDYGANEISFDLRRYVRVSPTRSVHLRLTGGGSLGGDPLTLQRRMALGGGDLLPGYTFRALRCDPRKVADASMPALCDRRIVAQIEFRQTLRADLTTRIGSYPIGMRQPDLVFFADAGSAWLAGDGVGQVPSNRIQTVREWRYDAGIGLDGGLFGVYLAKAITDREPVRLLLRFQRRF